MRRGLLLCAIAALCFMLAPVPAAHAYVKGAWFNATDAAHKVVTGYQTTLRGVCDNPAAATYEWKDASGVVVDTGAVSDSFSIESIPITITASGTYTLTVSDVDGVSLGSDTYAVSAVTNTIANLKDIAIDDGCWFMHKGLWRYITAPENGSAIAAMSGWDPTTPSIGQGFVDAGHLITGNVNDPYVEDVQRIFNFTTERLGIINFNVSPKGDAYDPENRLATAVKDKMGVFFARGDSLMYGHGPALRFLATCGYSRTSTVKPTAHDETLNYSGTLNKKITDWTYPQLLQQMVDFSVWAQMVNQADDYTTCVTWDARLQQCLDGGMPPYRAPIKRAITIAPGSKGGWPYQWEGWAVDATDTNNYFTWGNGTYGDVAQSYWMVLGLKAAETTLGATNIYPTYVKTDLQTFLANRTNSLTGEVAYGPAHNFHLVERAGQALFMMQWAGIASADARVTLVKNFIKATWNKGLNYHFDQDYPDQNFICHDANGKEVQCYSHYQLGGNPLGFFLCNTEWTGWNSFRDYNGVYDPPLSTSDTVNNYNCNYTTLTVNDDINVFAFKSVTDGLSAYGITDIPAVAPGDYKTIYKTLLINNQFDTGGWNDRAWIGGYVGGTGWALSTLVKL